MLGWEILISKKVQGSDKDLLIASWVTSTGGTSWIEALAKDGKAQFLVENSGYPCLYSTKAKFITPILSTGVPKFEGSTVIGEDYVNEAGSSWDIKINQQELSGLGPEDDLLVEAWDRS